MKYIFDLYETLIQSTTLNNDAYNYALEKFGFQRIITNERLTRNNLGLIPSVLLKRIVTEKQKYFTRALLPYRITLNVELFDALKMYGKKNCYLWTKASKNRVKSIFKFCGLDKLFNKIILDNKTSFRTSIKRLKALTHSDMFVVYENDDKFFDGEQVKTVKHIKSKDFDVKKYLVYA